MTDDKKILIDFPRKDGWSHLVGENIADLHRFAQSIGLKRHWFHNPRGKNKPHYDVRGEKIQMAVKNGAKQVSPKEVVKFLKEHYGK